MEIFFEPVSEFNPAVDLFTRPANHPRPWLVSMEMYSNLAPWFGHDPFPMAPMFPTTDQFLTNYRQTNSKMTEQSLIAYAKNGDVAAITALADAGFAVDWNYAITHVNGGWLPGEDIKRVWEEMVKINEETGMELPKIQTELQAALDKRHTIKPGDLAQLSPAGRPWDFNFKHKVKFGKGSSMTPPKKKRKK